MHGVRMVYIGNPAGPVEVDFYDTPGFAVHVAVVGDTIHVADITGGLTTLHFTLPPTPTPTATFTPGPSPTPTPTPHGTPTGPWAKYRDSGKSFCRRWVRK